MKKSAVDSREERFSLSSRKREPTPPNKDPSEDAANDDADAGGDVEEVGMVAEDIGDDGGSEE